MNALKLTPVTSVRRYISIDGKTVVRLVRSEQNLDAYVSPPGGRMISSVWGFYLDQEPDTFREVGSLAETLEKLAPRRTLSAAAIVSPRRFSEMVADAEGLGSLVFVGSLAVAIVLDWGRRNASRFCAIDVTDRELRFYTMVPTALYKESEREPEGVYATTFSFDSLSIVKRKRVAGPPRSAPRNG